MCGIVGGLGKSEIAQSLVDALRRLEYRGYDSAGIALLNNDAITTLRAKGKLSELQKELDRAPQTATVGIGHTRWATHGRPSVENAHPHATSRLALVHNGIIENFKSLKNELITQGVTFSSETDTEVVLHLIDQELIKGGKPLQAVQAVLPRLKGAFALALIFKGYDDLLIGARQGSPLVVGHADGAHYLGSDAIALAPWTQRITYLEEGDIVTLTRTTATVFNKNGEEVKRPVTISSAAAVHMDKGNHRHFMAKEIYEQSEVISHTLQRYVDFNTQTISELAREYFAFNKIKRLSITACGTAYYAGLVARYWFEDIAGVPVDIDIASEYRYRNIQSGADEMALFISQSGETADTLAALRAAKQRGQKTIAVVNVETSSIAREADAVFPILAGPEIGVASTKAFTCQLAALLGLALAAAKAKGRLKKDYEAKIVRELLSLPRLIQEALRLEDDIQKLSKQLSRAQDIIYLGRGTSYAIAMEGALKLKEISYIHAEGYAAGELKHGPIALIDEDVPVITVAPHDGLFEKTISNTQEVSARGGKIVLLTDAEGKRMAQDSDTVIEVPACNPLLTPFVYAIPIQLFAYHIAVHRGTDVDQPRNLAKSVTVE